MSALRILLFQPRFVEAIRAGSKTSTIRRSSGCKPGDVIGLMQWAENPDNSSLIREAVCESVCKIEILSSGFIFVDGKMARSAMVAKEEGFGGVSEMTQWFSENYGLPFTGELIRWKNEVPK